MFGGVTVWYSVSGLWFGFPLGLRLLVLLVDGCVVRNLLFLGYDSLLRFG